MKSYKYAVQWVADNDNPVDMDAESIAGYITTGLVADLFGKDASQVAADVLDQRINEYQTSRVATKALDAILDRGYPGVKVDQQHHHPDCQCNQCYYGEDAARWLFNPSEY